ncbi:MAG: Asp-tRNA(Asn)/Glu-tRNA(Gln) amidotransferase subunit GatC [Bacteroidia bacterium]|nr:Asp-tRNA(Asn)/Glu-tRNA(Gln) amidotransferase subunit GatC [Bacteroidia bacterium]MDW8301596.1 Asp-tRNA(Asn)/Glu-tRNA(Gln) amidotransferase subunit GatC [Bacteroidia bacterium]
MNIDENLIRRLANLAKLEFEGEDLTQIQQDLTQILNFVNKLNELDTTNVEPLIHIVDEVNHLREDIVKQEITHQEALSNAPKKDSDYIRVPKVLS